MAFFPLLSIRPLYSGNWYDILVSADNIAVKEDDNLLYSLTRKNRNFVVKTWAKQNGQNQIVNHTKYNNSNKRLNCSDYGCVYNKGKNKSVLLAYKKEDIVESCDKVNLVIQLSKFNHPICTTEILKYTDLEAHGTHSVWLTDSGIKVSKVRSNRPWHKPKRLI